MKIKEVEIKTARIEMMPLIDSFFLILVYFIYAFLSMSIHKGVPLDLPQASTAVEKNSKHIGVSITKEGDIYFDKVLVDQSALSEKLDAVKSRIEAKEMFLYIYGDKDASHGQVIEVFDLVRKSGIKKVFIETGLRLDEY